MKQVLMAAMMTLLLGTVSGTAVAQQAGTQETTAEAGSETGSVDETIASLRETLLQRMPDLQIDSINETVLPGIYELVSEAQIYYLSPDGKYMLDGSIINLEDRVNISDQRRGVLQLALLDDIPEDQMVVFDNESKDAERWITVFTDSDCGYCQKLHREIDEITQADIKVRYLLFPRAGMQSESFRELQSVWCSTDQQSAMTVAKSGGTVETLECENPIQAHVDLATRVGLRGTPLIFLDDGTKIPGYRPADELIRLVKDSEPMAMK